MSYGRLGTAPCGHRGEAIVGHYYACLEGCDQKAAPGAVAAPVVAAVRQGLPSHLGKPCRCLACAGYLPLPANGYHTRCECTGCRYSREITTLVAYAGGQRYQEFAWDGTPDAKFEIVALTSFPMQITSVSALKADGTLFLTHVFGGASLVPAPPLLATLGYVDRLTMQMSVSASGFRLDFVNLPATPAAPTGTTTAIPGHPAWKGWISQP